MAKNIFVRAQGSGNPTGWDIGFANPPAPGIVEIDLPECSGPEDIVFHLVARNAADKVIFNVKDPIWVKWVSKCPQKKGLHKQITLSGTPTDRQFTIHSDNSGRKRKLRYRLNFIGADPCDPIIINGGNGTHS